MYPPNILVADDSCTVRTIVNRALTQAGFDVRLARDGEEAVALATQALPDLAILDIQMPGIDGYAACQQILDLSAGGHRPPIIFLTKETASHLHALGVELGAYLPKPVNAEKLIRVVRELLMPCAVAGV
jgi:DNA-binding response OmpR family regulator